MSRKRLLFITIAFEGGLALIAWGLGIQFEIPMFLESPFQVRNIVFGVMVSLPILIAIAGIYRSSWLPFSQLKLDMERILPFFSQCSMLDLLLISIFAGIGEETFFRGFLQNTLMNSFDPGIAIFLVNIAFGFAHFISWTYVLYATLIGVYLSLMFMAFENLYIVIVAHAFYDFVVLIYFVRYRPRSSI